MPDIGERVILLGASTRAAAMSALRAGWTPWCADLFADADLARIATVRKIAAEDYPRGLIDALADAPPGPVIYTGALENRPDLIARMDRPFWGNSPSVLRAIRDPERWTRCLESNGIPCLAVSNEPQSTGNWMLKLRKSAGGYAIAPFAGQTFNARTQYLQERMDGVPCSAVFIGRDDDAILLGTTQQLMGIPWLNATGFHYAGSIGPMPLGDDVRARWQGLGDALVAEFKLRGLFGVDAILRDGIPWPVEINPRYTASIEVLERAHRWAFLRHHAAVFQGMATPPPPNASHATCGKAIVFARKTFAFPADGPWLDALKPVGNLDWIGYADIPHAREVIEAGRPVLTTFACGSTVDECERKLQENAVALARRLWG